MRFDPPFELVRWRPSLRRPLKFGKLESRCDGASDQRPVAAALGGLPRLCRHDGLRRLARGEIGAEPECARAIAVGDLQLEHAAGMIVPDLDRIDAMPVRTLTPRQQEIDRGGDGSFVRVKAGIAKRLAKMSALGMRLEV